MRFFSYALLFLHVIAPSLIAIVAGQPEWMYNSIFGVTGKAILAPVINDHKAGKESLRFMLNYYKNLEGNLTQPQAKKVPFETGNFQSVDNDLRFFGLPKLRENTRRVYLPVKPKKPANTRRRTKAEKDDVQRYKKEKEQFARTELLVFEALAAFGASLDKTNKVVNETVGWNNVYHGRRENYTTDSRTHTCKLRANRAFRVNGRWIIAALITNDLPEADLADGDRLYLSEDLYIDASEKVRAYPFHFNMSKGDSPEEFWKGGPVSPPPNLTRVTTRISRFGGQAGTSFTGSQSVENNVAFLAALGDSLDLTQQAVDSKSASNTAILVFPIFMAAIPIALFADVSDPVLLGYMICTDVITVLPLAIKGIELLYAGVKEFVSTRSLVYGDLNREGTVAVYTWTVRCSTAQNLTEYGAAFVAVAIAAMLVGITLEFLARAKVEKNKRDAAANAGIASLGVEYVWARNGVCTECQCQARAAKRESPGASQPLLAGGLIGQIQQRRKEASERSEVPSKGRDMVNKLL